MSNKKDYKTLEMLYEEISSFIFLEEEEQLFKNLAEKITKDIEKEKNSFTSPLQTDILKSFISSYLFNDSIQELNLEKDIETPFYLFYDYFPYKNFIEQNCFLICKENRERYVRFFDMQKRYIEVDIEDSEKIKENIEKYLKIVSQFFLEKFENLKDKQILTLFTIKFLDWRREKVKYQRLKNKLPELEGIF